MRRAALGVVAAAALIAGALAIGPSASATSSSSSASHDVFRVGTDTGIDSMNPFAAANTDSQTVFMNIYSYLLQYNSKFQFEPDLATSWKPLQGGRQWVFTIRSGVKWSDGKPLVAGDVAKVINWAEKTPGLGRVGEVFGTGFKGATAPTPTQLVLKWSQPNGVILGELARWPVLPPQQWVALDAKAAANYQNTTPIGSGPFVVRSYKKRQSLLAQRNPDWYGPKPKIAGFGLVQYSNDDAMIAALKSGEIDAAEQVPGPVFKSLKQDSRLNVTSTPSSFISDFIINSNPNKKTHRELLNPQVKQAFADAIDKRAILQLVFDGQGTVTSNIITNGYGKASGTTLPWQDPSIPQDTFDPVKANAILDKLGFKRSGNVRMANGIPMKYTLIVPTDGYSGILRVANLIQANLAKIGVQVTLQPEDSTAAYNTIIGSSAATKTPKNSYRDFDLAVWNWTAEPDASTLLVVATTGQFGALSDTGFSDPAYDALYNQEIHTLSMQTRVKLMYKMQQILAKRRPYIPLVNANELQAVDKHWQGIEYTPRGFFTELSKHNLETAQYH